MDSSVILPIAIQFILFGLKLSAREYWTSGRMFLELEKSATNEQVKKSYRDLAKKHHPDKVQHLGDVYVKAAQDKFQQIQKAYQNIKDERGF